MIKQLLNSVIAKYVDLLVSHKSIICLSGIIDQLATYKTQIFPQPHPVIVNCLKDDTRHCGRRRTYLL